MPGHASNQTNNPARLTGDSAPSVNTAGAFYRAPMTSPSDAKRAIKQAIQQAYAANRHRPQHAKLPTKVKTWRKRAKRLGFV